MHDRDRGGVRHLEAEAAVGEREDLVTVLKNRGRVFDTPGRIAEMDARAAPRCRAEIFTEV